MDFAKYLKDKINLIDFELQALFSEKDVPYELLLNSARYSLLSGGKRLRPILTLATTEAFNADLKAALRPACTLEMIHTYSLIHDDLPCMDNDDFRRGKPTLHKMFPEGHAVLTGDFLLTYAFEVLTAAPFLSVSQRLDLIFLLSRNAGSQGMIGGQVMDLASGGKTIDLESLRQIHEYKTASLIATAIQFGGIIAQASTSQLDVLHAFGKKVGLAYQIIDDILDVTASQQKHGKREGSDAINKKSTYISLLGEEASKELAHSLFVSALEDLQQLPINPSCLSQIAEYMIQRHS